MAPARHRSRRALLLAGSLVPLLGACALGSRSAPLPATAPVSSLSARQSPWKTLQLHAHSEYGGGTKSVAQLVSLAATEGVDALVISDHNDWR
jgi:hypothetical protein